MADPLAGWRQLINTDRERRAVWWPDRGRGCPVAKGQIFKLRTCHVEITRTLRRRQGAGFVWVAEFVRSYPERGPNLLARGQGDGRGYTRDPDLSIAADEDHRTATLADLEPEENPRNLGPPPEPEAVPSHEVETLPSTVAARARFESGRREETARRQRRSLIEEIREARLAPDEVERVRELVGELRR